MYLPRSRRETLADSVYGVVREAVLSCALMPGIGLSESQVAAQLQVGRTPVREALTRLVRENLLLVTPRSGYSVRPINVKEVEDLFGLRMIVEPAAVELAASAMTPALREELSRHDTHHVTSRGTEGIDAQRNTDFHVAIATASGNARVAGVVAAVLDEMARLVNFAAKLGRYTPQVFYGHDELMELVLAGNASAARRVSEQQISRSREIVLSALLGSIATLEVSAAAGLGLNRFDGSILRPGVPQSVGPPPERVEPGRRGEGSRRQTTTTKQKED